ncbi:pentapeptide repeat-containing protein [Nocardia sp. NBC_00565]|uniref:pentapeptide repeat-containing protein n=1 Tax=Nocardia sp. NBC_00565 TaxID=2975993 RepID=UPI002E807941|nr:pentapeptide repeat-containing protein [Nocardia sp. NBC_00565]WUC07621.1 pentapeptide repeat-containing protein [Nocardia sp. NBC_00565]
MTTPVDRIRVLETCAVYLRQHAGADSRPDPEEQPPADIAATLAAIRRHKYSADEPPLNLSRIRIPRANSTGARLTGADLAHTELTAATLRGATLTTADLTNCILERADLTATDLTRARLTGARLTETELTGAALTDADLRGADLRGSIGLTAEQLQRAHTDARTQLP